jgi:hypothetical protein
MRFFDYKFLILLGLTLVVYFIYREVEYLRNKVDKIETELNQKKLTLNETCSLELKDQKLGSGQQDKAEITNSVSKPVLQIPSNPNQNSNQMNNQNSSQMNNQNSNQMNNQNHNKEDVLEKKPQSANNQIHVMSPKSKKTISPQGPTSKSPQKLISLDFVSQSIQSPPSNLLNHELNTFREAGKIMNKITEILQEKSEDSDDDDDDEGTTTNLTSDHLAIYSNDNDQISNEHELTPDSSFEIESAKDNKTNKNEHYFNYMDDMDIKAKMDDIINSLESLPEVNDNELESSQTKDKDKDIVLDVSQNQNQSNTLNNLDSLHIARQLEIDEIIAEKENQFTEMSQKSDSASDKSKSPSPKPKLSNLEPKSSSPKPKSPSPKPKSPILESKSPILEPNSPILESKLSNLEPKSPILEPKSSNFKSKLSNPESISQESIKITYTADNLNKKKLIDIKEIAGKLNITFLKKVNGQQKYKSKQELIVEILDKNKK